jgi:hypothetical protein
MQSAALLLQSWQMHSSRCSSALVLETAKNISTCTWQACVNILHQSSWSHDRVDGATQGGSMVCYGCASGKSPAWPWQSWVFREQRVSGFNLRAWLARNPRKVCTIACHLHRAIGLHASVRTACNND